MKELKQELVRYSHLIYERGYVTSNQGNLSLRLDDGNFLITPTGIPKGMANVNDILVIDAQGLVLEGHGMPSMETMMHLGLYREMPMTGAIIHAHPLHVTALSLMGDSMDLSHIPEGADMLGKIPVVKYFPAGSDELADAVSRSAKPNTKAMVLSKHGAITFGPGLLSAYNNLERLEYACRLRYLILRDGG